MEKQLNVPKLRFPEFKGEWEKKKLGEIFSISAGGDIEIEHVSLTKNDKYKYPIYANAEKGKGFYGWSDIYKVEENVLTVAGRGVNIGIAHARDHKFYPIVRLLVLKPNKKENVKFFEYQVNRLNLFKESTGVPQLTVPQVSGYEVVIPSLPEQSRIASFFTAIDEKLKLETQRMAALKQYKKGVMQKLFSQELRFKDENGKEFPDWEVKKLGEISKIKTGKLDANAMVENGEYRFYTCAKDYFKIDKYAFDTEALLISGNGANVGYIHYFKGKFNAYQRTYILDGFKENIIYIKFYLQKFLSTRIDSEKKEGNTPYIVLSALSEMKILLPSLPEQTKIANFLSSIDDKIDQAEKRLQRIQMYKKGLLQQMFV